MENNAITPIDQDTSLITEFDVHLFREGNHFRAYEKLGAHVITEKGVQGAHFAVWAPNAQRVSVVGEFNAWNSNSHPLALRHDGSGIWQGFIPNLKSGVMYKYNIISNHHNYRVNKGDPYAFFWETPPKTASVVWALDYEWSDQKWMAKRKKYNSLDSPVSIYEVHAGSWKRVPEEKNRYLNYRELAHDLAAYVKEMGFTHIELMPIMEHPFYGSWGYQSIGYFAPSSRFGTPQDFMYFVDHMHQNNIGVILDWVPSHFPTDEHGLGYFDGTHLYEHEDMRLGFQPEWGSYVFNNGRNEIRNFLISSALFWLDKYHIDALRVDAVASMLYLDYARQEGEWIPNEYGGRDNLRSIAFIKKMNQVIYQNYPDVQTIAEESTAWTMVSRPVDWGGLGFGMKWNMGWMHDTLDYFSKDPVHRRHHHNRITFSIWYAFFENFVLPLSHDEVVYGKCSLLRKMPGDEWKMFAGLRLLLGYMWMHPGKKLLFMGGEFGQWNEWYHESSLDWHLLKNPMHQGAQNWLKLLNEFYKTNKALYTTDFKADGFSWLELNDWDNSTITFMRKSLDSTMDALVVACNFTPVPRTNFRIGVPTEGQWKEVLNSDLKDWGGSGQGNFEPKQSENKGWNNQPYSITITVPPLAIVVLKNTVKDTKVS